MSSFDEAKIRRDGGGKFATKGYSEADGGTDALDRVDERINRFCAADAVEVYATEAEREDALHQYLQDNPGKTDVDFSDYLNDNWSATYALETYAPKGYQIARASLQAN